MNDFQIIDENLRSAMRFFGYATGTGEIASLPGGIAMYSGLDYGVFNIAMMDGRVTHAGLTLEQRLVEISHYFKHKTPRWSLWVCEDLLDQATRRRPPDAGRLRVTRHIASAGDDRSGTGTAHGFPAPGGRPNGER
jgi:hypothetical protein